MPSKAEVRCRHSAMLPLAAPRRVDAGLAIEVENPDQPIGLRVGERLEHDAVHQREQQAADPDADGHRHDREQRQPGRSAQHAHGVQQFAQALIERETGSLFGHVFAGRFDGAHLDPGLASRFDLVETGGDLPRHHHLDVMRHLVNRFAIEPVRGQQLTQTPPERAPHQWPSPCRTLSIAAAVRSHALCCVVNRRRPAAVSA